MAVQNPVHFDIVGSFLRPERLKKAREAFRSGALGQAGLQKPILQIKSIALEWIPSSP